jgi:hypothetical protein
LHEIKFDGWRIQLHKHGGSAAAFTKNGHDHSSRVRWMTDALACLPGVRSLVIDGELVACNDAGLPTFTRCTFTRTIAACASGLSTFCTTPSATCANCLCSSAMRGLRS